MWRDGRPFAALPETARSAVSEGLSVYRQSWPSGSRAGSGSAGCLRARGYLPPGVALFKEDISSHCPQSCGLAPIAFSSILPMEESPPILT